MILDPFFLLCAVPAVLIFGIAKGGFGGSIGIVSVPLMAFAVSPLQAAAILLPILCVMDILAMKKFWRRWDVENLKIMLPAAILGVVIGTFTFKYLSEAHVRLLIGLLALGFSLNYYRKGQQQEQGRRPGAVQGTFWSVLAGFTSFGIHAGGPPVSVYLMPQKLPPTIFVGTCSVLFCVTNYVKLVPYFWLGQFSADNLWTSLMLLPLAPLGVGLGYWLHSRFSAAQFYGFFNFFLMIAGIKLIYDGLMAL
ncbi:sulfite exporter TauE/SafE family protein [Marinobacterium aestuariivivens]|uniref:Probable membrane transporter protein n=1 Tax=Marinobacterium aestuariivivens TaxID=1698799 RepID=A0ABW2A6K7_9GAMM